MKFTVQDIKLTLRNDSGDTFVIEESCDATPPRSKDKAQPSGGAKERPPRSEKSPSSKPADAESARAPAEKQAEKRAEKQAEKPEPTKHAAAERDGKKGTSRTQARARTSQRPKSLDWKPHKEGQYEGYAAKDGGQGIFKILRAKISQWGLFYDQIGVNSNPLGCFRDLEKAKAEAQRLHDQGMPDKRPQRPMCPADAAEPEAPRPEPAEPAPPTEPAAAPKPSDQDKELLQSFAQAADSLLNEED